MGPTQFKVEAGIPVEFDLSSYWATDLGQPIMVYVGMNRFDPILTANGITWTFAPSKLLYDGREFPEPFEGQMEFGWDLMPHPSLLP